MLRVLPYHRMRSYARLRNSCGVAVRSCFSRTLGLENKARWIWPPYVSMKKICSELFGRFHAQKEAARLSSRESWMCAGDYTQFTLEQTQAAIDLAARPRMASLKIVVNRVAAQTDSAKGFSCCYSARNLRQIGCSPNSQQFAGGAGGSCASGAQGGHDRVEPGKVSRPLPQGRGTERYRLEELQPFQLVSSCSNGAAFPFGQPHPSPWISGLMRAVRTGQRLQVIDHLICCSLVEGQKLREISILPSH